MASLTIDGYTFDNFPNSYSKRIQVRNSEVPHYKRRLSDFYQSGSKRVELRVSGRLSLNEQDDLTELDELKVKAIEGGEVEIDFNPFFAGRGVIVSNPFRESAQEGTYDFKIQINEETTDATAYPAHATPATPTTFTLGGFNFGYDPQTLNRDYARQTSQADRISAISQTEDNRGLVPTVKLQGVIDGAGQASLWEKAKTNALSYLEADKFQSGYALITDLEVSSNPDTPDFTQGVFNYNINFLVVSNPEDNIGTIERSVNRGVRNQDYYVSDCGFDGTAEADGLEYRVNDGTGVLGGDYLIWADTLVNLSDNTTNYVYVEDPDGDGYGDVSVDTGGFPDDVLELWEVTTSGGSVDSETDARTCLITETDLTASDLTFSDRLILRDGNFEYETPVDLGTDTLTLSDVADYFSELDLTDTPTLSDAALYLGLSSFTDTPVADDVYNTYEVSDGEYDRQGDTYESFTHTTYYEGALPADAGYNRDFFAVSVTDSPDSANAGGTVEIDADVTNEGIEEGTQDIELEVTKL